jgi:ribosomal protein S27AE
MALTDKQKTLILTSLQAKARGVCPRCGQANWSMQDEVVACSTTSLQGGMAFGGPIVPMVQIICTNCGFVAHHAIGALGINLSA